MNTEKASWSERFSLLSPWFADIMTVVKRDCKSEHLRLDPQFVRQHFGGVPVHKIRLEDMRAVYLQQLLAGQERLADFVANRWLFRNMDVYRFFETVLGKIAPEFEKIDELSEDQAKELLNGAKEQFGVEKVFCFVVLNEVALPKKSFDDLQRQALESLAERQQQEQELEEQGAVSRIQQELERTKERYEKKIKDLIKKHQAELVKLQKQISKLQSEHANV